MTPRLTRRARPVHEFRQLAWLAPLLAATACGATPPQAPFRQAKALDSATSGIAFACGEAYQVTAFPGDHVKDLEPVRSAATRSAAKLARVDALNPDWVYQGQTVAEIVHDGTADLGACGLEDAADVLKRRPRH
jgi:hypothetical protein